MTTTKPRWRVRQFGPQLWWAFDGGEGVRGWLGLRQFRTWRQAYDYAHQRACQDIASKFWASVRRYEASRTDREAGNGSGDTPAAAPVSVQGQSATRGRRDDSVPADRLERRTGIEGPFCKGGRIDQRHIDTCPAPHLDLGEWPTPEAISREPRDA